MTMTGHPLEKIKKDMSRAVWKSFLGDDVAALARLMAWRSTRRFRTNAPRSFDFHTARDMSFLIFSIG